MPIEVIVELVKLAHEVCQTIVIISIVLPFLICGTKCLYFLVKCYLEDKKSN